MSTLNCHRLTFRKPLPDFPESDDVLPGETCYLVEVAGQAGWYRREDGKSGRLVFLRYVQPADAESSGSEASDSDYEEGAFEITADQLARIHAFGVARTRVDKALAEMFEAGNDLLG